MIGAANAAIQSVKEIAELVKDVNDIPLHQKIVELQKQVDELATERLELASENRELKHKLEIKAKIRFENPYFWQEGDAVPLCPKCYSTSGETLRIHLTHPTKDFPGGHGRKCCGCGYFYYEGPKRISDLIAPPRDYWWE